MNLRICLLFCGFVLVGLSSGCRVENYGHGKGGEEDDDFAKGGRGPAVLCADGGAMGNGATDGGSADAGSAQIVAADVATSPVDAAVASDSGTITGDVTLVKGSYACQVNMECAWSEDCVQGSCKTRCAASCDCHVGESCINLHCGIVQELNIKCLSTCECPVGLKCDAGICK